MRLINPTINNASITDTNNIKYALTKSCSKNFSTFLFFKQLKQKISTNIIDDNVIIKEEKIAVTIIFNNNINNIASPLKTSFLCAQFTLCFCY